MDNHTLKIDEETRDLVFDEKGNLEMISSDETTAQAVRLTMQAYKKEFPLDITHGTGYDRIMGRSLSQLPKDEIDEVMREAIFQEDEVLQVDQLEIEFNGRELSVNFVGTLQSGKIITTRTEVKP